MRKIKVKVVTLLRDDDDSIVIEHAPRLLTLAIVIFAICVFNFIDEFIELLIVGRGRSLLLKRGEISTVQVGLSFHAF